MTSEVSFDEARLVVVRALSEHYMVKFPERRLGTESNGRDLGDAWAIFLDLVAKNGGRQPLLGSPVVVVSKADGSLSFRQIPPDFDILDAPLIQGAETSPTAAD